MKILTVCLGNICRSPIAQGILEAKIKEHGLGDWEVDSAGTSGWHSGEHPDKRAIQVCKKNGIDISRQVSRKITSEDLDYYDLILVMDTSNYRDVLALCNNKEQVKKIHLAMNYVFPDRNVAVPDPYYDNRFDEVFSMLDDAMERLVTAESLVI
ncbi:MAG: low molecular weight phosphotyrosine protein phosphatase [Saprospiraceae bacterium]|nr:low molecular weight phosphotyrosine protein phosphatase [Saprospiraceae bacterium]MCZ2336923.1 low molecular weight phosphotyrosine protein phosphatase [Chitinophagales bacterium]